MILKIKWEIMVKFFKRVMFQRNQILLALFIGFLHVPNMYANKGDWPQWGGSDERNMVSDALDLPEDFDVGKTLNQISFIRGHKK